MSWLQIVDNQDCCKLCTVNKSHSALSMCVCSDVLVFRAGNRKKRTQIRDISLWGIYVTGQKWTQLEIF